MSHELLLTSDTGRILGVSSDEVRRLHRIGRLSATITHGGVRLFRREDVEPRVKPRETGRLRPRERISIVARRRRGGGEIAATPGPLPDAAITEGRTVPAILHHNDRALTPARLELVERIRVLRDSLLDTEIQVDEERRLLLKRLEQYHAALRTREVVFRKLEMAIAEASK